jgi:flagellar motor switch/type III secretory pathway protein FliN
MAGVELFDFRDLSELSQESELRASESLSVGVPRAALVLSAITRRNVTGSLVRFELVDRRDVPVEGCDLYDITVAVPSAPGAAGTRRPLGVAVVPRPVVTGLAELLMGGPGDGENRLPSRFERSLLSRRMAEVLAPLWEGLGIDTVEPPGLTYVGTPLAQLPSSPVAVVVRFALGERNWEFTLALTSAVVDTGLDLQPAAEASSMARAVRDVPIELKVAFGPIKVQAGDVGRLAVGDVIRMDHTVGVPVVVEVQGRPLLLVSHGTTGRRVAFEVVEVLDAAELAQLAAEDAAAMTTDNLPIDRV